jgi:hypothetical protein
MNLSSEQLVQSVLSLPEEERKGIFLSLAKSLPPEVTHLAESARRADEMRTGSITPISEGAFLEKMTRLRGTLRPV